MRKNVPQSPGQILPFIKPVIAASPINSPRMRKVLPSVPENILATVILESEHDDQFDTQERFETVISVLSHLTTNSLNNGIVVFPGGMFFTGDNAPSSLYSQIEEALCSFLATIGQDIIVCFGIDGSKDREGYARDQIAVAVDRTGIIALGRKFYPQKTERGHVNLAENFNCPEQGKPRIFRFGNASFYLAMCYDTFGIKNLDIKNPGVNGVIELAHCFYPKGQGPSGDPYFARHGFAGASRQWNCPVYGTAVFFKRHVPERWPSGVIWNKGSLSTTEWHYEMNPLKPGDVVRMKIDEGTAVVRLFSIGV